MNEAHFHLLINHFPIIGIIIGSISLLVAFILKSSTAKKMALWILFFSSVLSIPTFASGEGAEEVVEHLPNFTKQSHHLLHEHEEKAEFFMTFSWILIFLSIITLFLEWKKNKIAKYAVVVTIIFSIVSIVILKEVGTSGGEISHPEIIQKHNDKN
ncbi:MAG: hypothetical protein HYU67_05685 [Flavobacteriia bacterium]|nr:hypothetical protein [Flavobacteriia bacterium]